MALVDIKLGEDQVEGTKAVLSQWLVSEGDTVEINQPILELETDKVMMEVISPANGVLIEKLVNTDDEVSATHILGRIDNSKKSTISFKEEPTTPLTSPSAGIIKKKEVNVVETSIKQNDSTLISPSVRRLITKHNLNINDIKGSGKNNRLTTRDIDNFLKVPRAKTGKSSNHLPISNMRRSIANHMVDSLLHTAPHVTSIFNLDLSAIIKHRQQNKTDFAEKGANLTFTSYFIAASAIAIDQQPLINSQLHKDSIEVFKNINIGIGTALNDAGLIVPVLKNCEGRDLFSIAKELTRLTNKARSNKLKPKDVQDGTFTLSNHGVSGSLIATPIIINQPQSAILGLGKMEKRVVVKEFEGEDVMLIKPMCYVTLTIDHRVLDAQQCNQFLSIFVEALENWK